MPRPGFVRTKVEMKGPITANTDKEVFASAILRLIWEGYPSVFVQIAFALNRNYETKPSPLYLYIKRGEVTEWNGAMPIDKILHEHVIKHQESPLEFLVFAVESIGHGAQNLCVENFIEFAKSRKRVA